MCLLSQFKDIFGKPNEGLHSYRFLNAALVDYLLTFVIIIAITLFFGIPLVASTIIAFVAAVVIHYLFGVETNTVRWLGLKC